MDLYLQAAGSNQVHVRLFNVGRSMLSEKSFPTNFEDVLVKLGHVFSQREAEVLERSSLEVVFSY